MHTPVLDALAGSGTNLHGYFTNSPVCVPSRCTLFTGRYPHSHKVRENYTLLEAGREFHLFRILKQAKYKLGYVGKNHLLDEAEKQNFDCFSLAGSHELSSPDEQVLDRAYNEHLQQHGLKEGQSDAAWRAGFTHTQADTSTRSYQTAESAIDFLNSQAGSAQPFALCVSFEDPHVPHIARAADAVKYPLDEIELYPDEGDIGLSSKARRWLIKKAAQKASEASTQDKKRYIATYRAMISWIDTQIGRVLDTLESLQLRENTLIVFTSDHGDFNFEHGLAKKDLILADSLLHVPCIFSQHNQIVPQTRPEDCLVEEVDILPTILDLLGVKIPFGIQGVSFASVLKGTTKNHKEAVYAEISPPYLRCGYSDFPSFEKDHEKNGKTPFNIPGDFCKSIRTRDWRYVWYATGEEELYNHQSDPNEHCNLAKLHPYASIKQKLKLRLLEWNALTEDPLDTNLGRELQKQYTDWVPVSFQDGFQGQPSWKPKV